MKRILIIAIACLMSNMTMASEGTKKEAKQADTILKVKKRNAPAPVLTDEMKEYVTGNNIGLALELVGVGLLAYGFHKKKDELTYAGYGFVGAGLTMQLGSGVQLSLKK